MQQTQGEAACAGSFARSLNLSPASEVLVD
jgi:hypothetical protein